MTSEREAHGPDHNPFVFKISIFLNGKTDGDGVQVIAHVEDELATGLAADGVQ